MYWFKIPVDNMISVKNVKAFGDFFGLESAD